MLETLSRTTAWASLRSHREMSSMKTWQVAAGDSLFGLPKHDRCNLKRSNRIAEMYGTIASGSTYTDVK